MAKNTQQKYNKVRVGSLEMMIKTSVATDVPLLILGGFGVGKSAIVAQMADKLGYVMVDVRLSQMLPEDLGGLPVPAKKGEYVVRLMPDLIARVNAAHKAAGKPVLLFLDEITSGLPTILAAAYQLVLDRCLGEYCLPEGTRIVCAGNRPQDKGVTYDMPRPMANRMMIVEFEGATWEEFETYAIKAEFHPLVISALKQQPTLVCSEVDMDDEEGRNPTPRTWEFVSRIMYHADDTGVRVRDRMLQVAAVVGDAAALKFETVLRMAEKLVSFEEITADPEKAAVYPNDLAASYLQMMLIVERIGEQKQFDTVFKYVERMPKELIGVFFRSVLLRPAKSQFLLKRIDLLQKYREFATAGVGLAA
jgi:hypothetical protein